MTTLVDVLCDATDAVATHDDKNIVALLSVVKKCEEHLKQLLVHPIGDAQRETLTAELHDLTKMVKEHQASDDQKLQEIDDRLDTFALILDDLQKAYASRHKKSSRSAP